MANMIVTVQSYGFYDAALETQVYEGLFQQGSEWNGKPTYYFDNHEYEGNTEIQWVNNTWRLILDDNIRYESSDDTPTPDLATWVGCTVTAEQSGTTHEGEVTISSLSYLRTKKA